MKKNSVTAQNAEEIPDRFISEHFACYNYPSTFNYCASNFTSDGKIPNRFTGIVCYYYCEWDYLVVSILLKPPKDRSIFSQRTLIGIHILRIEDAEQFLPLKCNF